MQYCPHLLLSKIKRLQDQDNLSRLKLVGIRSFPNSYCQINSIVNKQFDPWIAAYNILALYSVRPFQLSKYLTQINELLNYIVTSHNILQLGKHTVTAKSVGQS